MTKHEAKQVFSCYTLTYQTNSKHQQSDDGETNPLRQLAQL